MEPVLPPLTDRSVSLMERIQQIIDNGEAADFFIKFGIGVLVLLAAMILAVYLVRRLARLLVLLIAGGGCVLYLGLLAAGQLDSWPEVALGAAVVGLSCGLLAIPALTIEK